MKEREKKGVSGLARALDRAVSARRRSPPEVSARELGGGETAQLRAWLADLGTYFAVSPPPWATEGDAVAPVVLRASGSPSVSLTVLADDPRQVRRAGLRLLPMMLDLSAALAECGRQAPAGGRCRAVYIDLPSPARRMPSAPGAPFLPSHINGGLCARDGGAYDILVYRRGDAAKVLAHEMLHLHGVDDAMSSERAGVPRLERRLCERHRVDLVAPVRRFGLNEAFCETLACYAHARWWILEKHKTGPGRASASSPTPTWPQLRGRLVAHFEATARRAVAHFGGAPFGDGTHAFAYLVCKAALWKGGIDRFVRDFADCADPAAFARRLEGALDGFDPTARGSGAAGLPRRAGAALSLTPLQ